MEEMLYGWALGSGGALKGAPRGWGASSNELMESAGSGGRISNLL